jgi:uncharacterized membrane protein YraQ (UPF0718 family)
MAVTLGAVTPFCSCSSVPLFIGFVEAGIPLGVTFSFLIASPMINEVAAVILVGILGWKLAALYVAAGWLGGIAGGVGLQSDRLRGLSLWTSRCNRPSPVLNVASPGKRPCRQTPLS